MSLGDEHFSRATGRAAQLLASLGALPRRVPVAGGTGPALQPQSGGPGSGSAVRSPLSLPQPPSRGGGTQHHGAAASADPLLAPSRVEAMLARSSALLQGRAR